MPQHADTRSERHAAAAARWAAAARSHRIREAKARDKGRTEAADQAAEAAVRAERFAQTNARKVKALGLPAARARVARRVNDASAETILARAVRRASETPHPAPPLSAQEQRRADKAAAKRERTEREAAAYRARHAREAQVDHDPRTAAAQREVAIAGPASAKRASVAEAAALIRSKAERTPERIRAIEMFDVLCHRTLAGQIATPRYERGVDVSRSIPGVPDDRADAAREMQRLTAYVGVDAQAILFHRIFERRTFAWMEADGQGDAELLGLLFLRAVDGVARFYGISAVAPSIEAMGRRLGA